MADGKFSLPLNTVCCYFVYYLALLMSMATGALTDAQIQEQRMDEFS